MSNWKKALLLTLVTLAIGAVYLFVVFEQRSTPGPTNPSSSEPTTTADDLAVVRAMMLTTYDDALKMQGITVWMKNGYVMPYYAFEGGHVVFA
jgi:zona occludens toxin (predicted ATPase)